MSDTSTTTPAGPASALPAQLKALWAKLPARARTAVIASTVAIVGLVIYLVVSSSGGPSYQNVTDGLDKNDAKILIGELNKAGIPIRLRNGRDVLVPSSRHAEAVVIASVAGVPSSRSEDVSPNPTETTQGFIAKLQRALQNRLTNSLERLGPIERATVQLAMARETVFTKGGSPAKASVTVHLRPGARLTRQQVSGIKQFVANGVQNLSVENVTVIDQNANPLSEGADDPNEQQSTEEHKLADNVRAMIEPVVGADKVKVTARIEYDRRIINTTDESFHDPAIRSQEITSTPGGAASVSSGIAGTQGNLPGAQATTTTAATGSNVTRSLTNNEVGRKVVQTQDPADRIAKVSVVVLLADDIDEDGEPLPRATEEVAKITAMAHTAAGLDDARGDKLTVAAMAFAPPPEVAVVLPPKASKLPVPMPIAAGGGAALLIAVVLLLTRRKRKPAEDSTVRVALPAPVSELERALSPTAIGEAPAAPALPPGRSLEERVVGAVKTDIPRASRVLAGWLAEADPVPTSSHKSARA